MSKYEPLGRFLQNKNLDIITLTFNEIEDILGFDLPNYLRKWEAGWYGTAEASPTHVQKAVWQSAGYIVGHVSIIDEMVMFKKI